MDQEKLRIYRHLFPLIRRRYVQNNANQNKLYKDVYDVTEAGKMTSVTLHIFRPHPRHPLLYT